MTKEKKIKLCEHLEVGKPETVNDSPAKLRCGQCYKIWVWNKEEQVYVCIFDPEKNEKLSAVGQMFR